MQRHRYFSLLRTSIVALVLMALVPLQPVAASQTGANSFESTLGYVVTWNDNWEFDETLMFEAEGAFDIITLWNEDAGFLMISGYAGTDIDPATLLEPDEDETVISSELEGDIPQLVTEDDTFRTLSEGYVIDNGALGITASLTSMPVTFDDVLANAQEGVQVNGSPVLTGEPLADSGSSSLNIETEDPTEESNTGVTRTTRGGTDDSVETSDEPDADIDRSSRSSDEDETTGPDDDSDTDSIRTTRSDADEETPEVTEEADSGSIRTTRSDDSEETPEVTEASDSDGIRTTRSDDEETPVPPEETEDQVTSGLETYQGPVFGYSFEYDDEIWTVQNEYQDEGTDGLSMTTSTSTVTIWAWEGYGDDPVACLDGEAAYYETEVDNISNWEQVMDANGEPLRSEGEDISWGVFSLTYENERGNQTELIDYISCQPIPGENAVLMVLLSSAPENYNDNLDLTFDVLDTLQFGEAPVVQDPVVETPTTEAATTESGESNQEVRDEIDTNFEGSQYTSPNYGFTVYVPLEWQIVEESVEGSDEVLVLDNGTSVVTLWATPAPASDLEGCVDYAAESSGYNLELLENSSGGAFRGEYGDEAFGNFVYSDGGTEMMYFISCKVIPGTDGVLILTHDVPFDEFTSERRFRNEIEESITMP